MANLLKVAFVHTILTLRRQGWSFRQIASELGIHRETVARHVRLSMGAEGQNRPEVIPGSDSPQPADRPIGSGRDPSPAEPGHGPDGGPACIALRPTADGDRLTSAAGEDRALPASNLSGSAGPYGTGGIHPGAACSIDPTGQAGPKPANVISGEPLSRSRCEPYRDIILSKLPLGLTAQRIWQDLRDENGFADSYQSVQRFVRDLQTGNPQPFRRMECEPGQEVQIDFGKAAPIVEPDGRRRRPHLFRIVLSCSRKAYSEAVYRQTTDDFLRCLENAFWSFGGVPRTGVPDNLKAAVIQADWYDPELNPKIQSFCEHYGIAILPTKPRTPRHKGKIERGVGYAQSNAIKGRTFSSLAEQNRFLQEWETHIADKRIHGTTRRQVGNVFTEIERPALLPLPAGRFPFFAEAKRKVNRDGHVEVAKAYYSVPPEYLGREVWARWDGRLVRIFNSHFQQIALHVQAEPGKFSTQDEHIPAAKRSGVERGATSLLEKASRIGPQAGRWSEQMLHQRGIEGVRVLMGLISLTKQHPSESIEQACQTASTHGAYRLRTIRELLKRQADRQEPFEFLDEHPIIRSLSDYAEWVHTAFHEEEKP
ncbi:MAG TPA: IS21 family transposase [Phycisphaerae bacterium]|nr:IS21 family transposase [Phycisphaerae bacterium]